MSRLSTDKRERNVQATHRTKQSIYSLLWLCKLRNTTITNKNRGRFLTTCICTYNQQQQRRIARSCEGELPFQKVFVS